MVVIKLAFNIALTIFCSKEIDNLESNFNTIAILFIISNWITFVHCFTLAFIKLVILSLCFPIIVILAVKKKAIFNSARENPKSLGISLLTIIMFNDDYEETRAKCLFCTNRILGNKFYKFNDCKHSHYYHQ